MVVLDTRKSHQNDIFLNWTSKIFPKLFFWSIFSKKKKTSLAYGHNLISNWKGWPRTLFGSSSKIILMMCSLIIEEDSLKYYIRVDLPIRMHLEQTKHLADCILISQKKDVVEYTESKIRSLLWRRSKFLMVYFELDRIGWDLFNIFLNHGWWLLFFFERHSVIVMRSFTTFCNWEEKIKRKYTIRKTKIVCFIWIWILPLSNFFLIKDN